MSNAVYGTPAPLGEPYPALLAIAEAEEPDLEADLKLAIPEEWNGKYISYFQPIKNVGNPEYAFLSHYVLFEGPSKENVQDVFFGDQLIRGGFCILWFSEERQKYYNLHCFECAMGSVRWFAAMQDNWKQQYALGKAQVEGPKTYQ